MLLRTLSGSLSGDLAAAGGHEGRRNRLERSEAGQHRVWTEKAKESNGRQRGAAYLPNMVKFPIKSSTKYEHF